MFELTHKPIRIDRISQPYKVKTHKGIDIVDSRGTGAPIYAAADGTVCASSKGAWDWSYGQEIAIYHGNGNYTNYAHLSKRCVKQGKKVKAGDIIGYQGSTGRSTGNHLHFEVHLGRKWNRVDPKPYLDNIGVYNYKVKTNGSNLNVRNKDNKIIGKLENGSKVHVIEYGDKRSRIDKPVKGYVASRYLTKLEG